MVFMWSCQCRCICLLDFRCEISKDYSKTLFTLPILRLSMYLHWLGNNSTEEETNKSVEQQGFYSCRMQGHYSAEWNSCSKTRIYLAESKMEACLLKLADSWSVAPCFTWQGFHLYKQNTSLKELAICQQATYLDRILLTVVNRWDWDEGWAHTCLCVSKIWVQ